MTNHSYFSFLCRTITALFFFQLLWITSEYKMTIIICNKTCSLLYKCSYTILFLCRTMRTVTLLKVFDGNHLKTSVNEQMFLWLKMYLNRYFTLIWRFLSVVIPLYFYDLLFTVLTGTTRSWRTFRKSDSVFGLFLLRSQLNDFWCLKKISQFYFKTF